MQVHCTYTDASIKICTKQPFEQQWEVLCQSMCAVTCKLDMVWVASPEGVVQALVINDTSIDTFVLIMRDGVGLF